MGDATELRHFQQQFEKLISFRHPAVERIHEVHADAVGACYLLCEPRHGETLDQLLVEKGRFKLDEVRAIARQIVDALAAAHAAGFAHGNLSLASIELAAGTETSAQKTPRVKLRDFGLGRRLAPSLYGALGYLAPEQVDSTSPAPVPTEQSDQFALGVILFELLSGWRIFAGKSFAEVSARLLRQDPPHVQLPDVGAREGSRVIRTLHKAMARLPDQRFPTLQELVTALEGSGSRVSNAPRPRPSSSDAVLPPEDLRVSPANVHRTQVLLPAVNHSPTLISDSKQTERNLTGRISAMPESRRTRWLVRLGTTVVALAGLIAVYRCAPQSGDEHGMDASVAQRPDISRAADLNLPAPRLDVTATNSAMRDAPSKTVADLAEPSADLRTPEDLLVVPSDPEPVKEPQSPTEPKVEKGPKKSIVPFKRGPAKKRQVPPKEVGMELACKQTERLADCIADAANRCLPKLGLEDEGASIDLTYIFKPEVRAVSLAERSIGPLAFVGCMRKELIENRLCEGEEDIRGFLRCKIVRRRTSQ